jgi:hypothetical protein
MGAMGPVEKQRQSLAELWNETSLLAPRWLVQRSILTGLVAVVGLALNPSQWTYSTVYLIIGCFGARALWTGQDDPPARRARRVLDVVASVATGILVLQVLKVLLGGTVGLIRA